MRRKYIGFITLFLLLMLMLYGCKKEENPKGSTSKQAIDFVVEVEEGRDIKVLQLTDIEIIDSSQGRTGDRLVGVQYAIWQPQNMEKVGFQYIRQAIERAEPDFIIITGDLIYGEFDDAGTSMEALIEFMDSFKIPWSPVFGDLERESKKGADWQCEKLENSKYCRFKKGDTDGEGNYSVGIKQGDELVRVFYMMDGNGAISEERMEWLYNKMSDVDKENQGKTVPASLCYHHPTIEAVMAGTKYITKKFPYTINENVRGDEGDFGSQNAEFGGASVPGVHDLSFVELLQKFHVDSVFMGHCHKVNTSITYEGIRWTFGLKSSAYEMYDEKLLGGTQITLHGNELSVEHLYADKEYENYLKNMDFY